MRCPVPVLAASILIGCTSDIADLPPRGVTPASNRPLSAVAPASVTLGNPARLDCAKLHVRLVGAVASAGIETDPACPGKAVARVRAVATLENSAAAPLRGYTVSLSLRNSTPDFDFGRPFAIIADFALLSDAFGPSNRSLGTGPVGFGLDPTGTTGQNHPIPEQPFWTLDSELGSERSQPAGLLESGEESGIRTIAFAVRPELRDFTIPLAFHIETQLFRGFAFAETDDPSIPAVAANKDGSRLAFFAAIPGGPITSIVLTTPNGTHVAVWVGTSGLPDHAVIGPDVVLYDHWTPTSVDIAIVHQNGEVIIRRGVSRVTAIGTSATSQTAAQFGLFDVDAVAQSLAIRNPFSDWSSGLRFVSDGLLCFADVGLTVSSTFATAGLAALSVFSTVYGCGTWLAGSLLPDGTVSFPASYFGTSLGAAITALGCLNPATCLDDILAVGAETFSALTVLYFSNPNVETARTQLHSTLPNPVLAFTGTEAYTANNSNFVRYKLVVTNYQAYPADMFAPAPSLPPCGLNTNASRTWVNIYDASTNSPIEVFCGLATPADLQSIWFAEPAGTPPPSQVYIELVDRATGVTYMSNHVVP